MMAGGCLGHQLAGVPVPAPGVAGTAGLVVGALGWAGFALGRLGTAGLVVGTLGWLGTAGFAEGTLGRLGTAGFAGAEVLGGAAGAPTSHASRGMYSGLTAGAAG